MIALCRVHVRDGAYGENERTSRCQPAHDALAKCDPHPGLLGKACSEHLRPSLGSGHSGATLGAMFTRTNAAAPRAGQCDARPRRGLTPYRPAQRFTCSSRPTAVATARLGHLRPCETPVQASAIHHPRLIAGNRCAVVICRRRSTTQHCRKKLRRRVRAAAARR